MKAGTRAVILGSRVGAARGALTFPHVIRGGHHSLRLLRSRRAMTFHLVRHNQMMFQYRGAHNSHIMRNPIIKEKDMARTRARRAANHGVGILTTRGGISLARHGSAQPTAARGSNILRVIGASRRSRGELTTKAHVGAFMVSPGVTEARESMRDGRTGANTLPNVK